MMQRGSDFRNEYYMDGHTMVYQMPKELDQHIAQNLCRELDMLVETYPVLELILDFSQTEFMDSSGIGVVIGRSKTMQYRGGKCYVTRLSARIQAVFRAAALFQIVQVKEV